MPSFRACVRGRAERFSRQPLMILTARCSAGLSEAKTCPNQPNKRGLISRWSNADGTAEIRRYLLCMSDCLFCGSPFNQIIFENFRDVLAVRDVPDCPEKLEYLRVESGEMGEVAAVEVVKGKDGTSAAFTEVIYSFIHSPPPLFP